MKRFVLWVLVNAAALGVATWLLDGMYVTGHGTLHKVWTMIGVGLIFGLVNAVIGPIVKLLSLPFILLTLGLLIFVINACLLLLTGWLSGVLGLDFHVDGFWTAVWGAIIIAIVSAVLNVIVRDRD